MKVLVRLAAAAFLVTVYLTDGSSKTYQGGDWLVYQRDGFWMVHHPVWTYIPGPRVVVGTQPADASAYETAVPASSETYAFPSSRVKWIEKKTP